MEFLTSSYGTDSESDEEAKVEFKLVSKPVNVTSAPTVLPDKATKNRSTSSTHVEAPKRVKKLDISLLPQDIQDALLKGSSAYDSDDDDWKPKTKLQKKSDSKPDPDSTPFASSSSVVNSLLQMLPPPKSIKKEAEDPFAAAMKDRAEHPRVEADKKSMQSHDIPESRDARDNDGSSLSSSNAVQSQLTAASSSSSSVYQASQSYASVALPSVPSVSLLPTPSVYAEYGAMPQPEGYDMSAYHSQPQDSDTSSSKNKKKRERDLEAQLMAGDMSVLSEARVADIQGFNSWDSRAYMDQQAREASIIKQYTGPDSNKSLLQPNRVQNRKHQLTSLAMRAAETELALLDARGARMKTKSQTQSKYGW